MRSRAGSTGRGSALCSAMPANSRGCGRWNRPYGTWLMPHASEQRHATESRLLLWRSVWRNRDRDVDFRIAWRVGSSPLLACPVVRHRVDRLSDRRCALVRQTSGWIEIAAGNHRFAPIPVIRSLRVAVTNCDFERTSGQFCEQLTRGVTKIGFWGIPRPRRACLRPYVRIR